LTVADLRGFLAEFPSLEVLPHARAQAFVTNVRRYLDDVGVLDTDQLTDLHAGDLAELHRRAKPAISDSTRKTYTGQLIRAIAMLSARAAEDPLWAISRRERATGKPTAAKGRRPAATRKEPDEANAKKQPPAAKRPSPPPQPSQVRDITYPFPLRIGQVINVSLPADLRRSEAYRLGAFIAALAVDGTGDPDLA
jgi:hypothetical protein